MPAPTGAQYDVFVSYSHADRPWVVKELLPRLENAGLRVCIDYRDFRVGLPSIANMEWAVDVCRHTLLVLTPDWVKSEWTAFESILSQTQTPTSVRYRTLPLLLKPCRPPHRISAITHADFTQPGEQTLQFRRLLERLQEAMLTASVQPEIPAPVPDDVPSGQASDEGGKMKSVPSERGRSRSVGRGLAALLDLMRVPEARSAIIAFRSDFEAAREQIDTISSLKYLHDVLQELENRYKLLYSAWRRLPNDEAAWEDLEDIEPEIHGSIDELVSFAGRLPLMADAALWLRKLSRVQGALRAAVEGSDQKHLAEAARGLRDVLGREPSKINTRLVAAAGSLRLPALVQAMQTVRANLRRSGLDQAAQQRLAEIEQAVEALCKLDDSLTAMVATHNCFQAMDDELRWVDGLTNQDVGELEEAWQGVKPLMDKVCAASDAEWATKLCTVGAELASALAADNPAPVPRVFRRYRAQAAQSFNQVDKDLLSLCAELQLVCEPLTRVLWMMQHD